MLQRLPVRRVGLGELLDLYFAGGRVYVLFSDEFDVHIGHDYRDILGLPPNDISRLGTDLYPLSDELNPKDPYFVALEAPPDPCLYSRSRSILTENPLEGLNFHGLLQTLEEISGFMPVQAYLLVAGPEARQRTRSIFEKIIELRCMGLDTALFAEENGVYLVNSTAPPLPDLH